MNICLLLLRCISLFVSPFSLVSLFFRGCGNFLFSLHISHPHSFTLPVERKQLLYYTHIMTDETFIGGISIPQRSGKLVYLSKSCEGALIHRNPTEIAHIFFLMIQDDALLLLQNARSDGFDFVTTNLPYSSSLNRRDVTLIESKWWSTSIVGMVTSPPVYMNEMEMSDSSVQRCNFGQDLVAALSKDSASASVAADHLSFMLEWAAHMNIPAVILPPIPKDNFVDYGRFLATQTLKSSANNVQLWVRVAFDKESMQRFHMVHRLCDGAANLGCIIMFNSSVDTTESLGESMSLLHKLVGCNLRAVVFNTDIFLSNKRGFPTLSKSHQFLFVQLLKRLGRTCRVLVEGINLHIIAEEEAMGRSGLLLYLQYLRHLRSKDEVKDAIDTEEGRMETSYLDHLQSALQPLGDNLEFSTYEVVRHEWFIILMHHHMREYLYSSK